MSRTILLSSWLVAFELVLANLLIAVLRGSAIGTTSELALLVISVFMYTSIKRG